MAGPEQVNAERTVQVGGWSVPGVTRNGQRPDDLHVRRLPAAAVAVDTTALIAISVFTGIQQFDTWLAVIAWVTIIMVLLCVAVGLAVVGWRRARAAEHGGRLALTALAVSVACLIVPAGMVLYFLIVAEFFPDSLGGG
jgi:hypothetical protein